MPDHSTIIECDTGAIWATADEFAAMNRIAPTTARKRIRKGGIGVKVPRPVGGLEWMAYLPAWRAASDTGFAAEVRHMHVLSARLTVP